MRPISEIAHEAGIPASELFHYGPGIAKVRASVLEGLAGRPRGRLVIVTAMSPTPEGVGKTTLTIGLTDALRLLGKKAIACIRQPSMGPLLGAKGGATGSGLARVEPSEDISLHFTGDDYAVSTAHNLVSSMLDNHIYHGNRLGISKVRWSRVSAVNDRALRKVRVGLGKAATEREDEFHITAASELMAILSLSRDFRDLQERVSRVTVASREDGSSVTIKDLLADGAVCALLKKALDPNLVQTAAGSPVFVHTGPFGNISIGCSSAIAASIAMRLGEYVLTEAGFSTELGAEKFFDIVCREALFRPAAAVIVATLGALRLHGGAKDFRVKDMDAVRRGLPNLARHVENVCAFGVPSVVLLNRFREDTDKEIRDALSMIGDLEVPAVSADVRETGAMGGLQAAAAIIRACEAGNSFGFLYPLEMPLREKIDVIARRMYGADGVDYTEEAEADLRRLEGSALPVCVAKTPKSLSDDPALIGRPGGFRIKVRSIVPATGAGYLVAICGGVLLMPGMPEHPLAEGLKVDAEGRITGI